MRDYKAIRERYLRDDLPTRLGGLAANLARIKSFSSHEGHGQTVESLLDESKHFIEWTAPDADLDTQATLVELQVQLALWQRTWNRIWPSTISRMEVAEQAGMWSEQVLEMSGLLI